MAWRVAAVLALLILAVLGAGVACGGGDKRTPEQTASATSADSVPCEPRERLEYHLHAHLAVFVEGEAVPVPVGVGLTVGCIHYLHTHDGTGVIHVEAPAARTFTLGDFFRLWGQPVSATHLLDRRTDATHEVRAFVNGAAHAGDPADILLHAHDVIVVEYGPPFVPPPAYAFRPGL